MMTNYIVAHKNFPVPDVPTYKPIQVGFGEDLGWIRDNTGDNIAEKNGSFCELTALYWIWKNDDASDIIGIHHYRRYFTDHPRPSGMEDFLKEEKIQEILQDHDVIAAKFEPYKETVYEQYCTDSGFAKDLDTLRSIISKQCPEYLSAYDTIMNQGGICQYNMVIAPKETYDRYCSWLFPLLFELESITDLSGYNSYQKRIYGFLAERLFNVWLYQNKLNVKELPVYSTEVTAKENRRLAMRRLRNRLQYQLVHHKPNQAKWDSC